VKKSGRKLRKRRKSTERDGGRKEKDVQNKWMVKETQTIVEKRGKKTRKETEKTMKKGGSEEALASN